MILPIHLNFQVTLENWGINKMPAASNRQARFFRMVRGVQSGNIPASKVSPNMRKTAKSISAKAASDFTHTDEIKKLKEFIKGVIVREQLKKSIQSVINEVLNEDVESPVVRNVQSNENFDDLLAKPENVGEAFNQKEIDAVNRLDTKPYKVTPTEVKFSSVDDTSEKNKEMVVRKIKGKYVAFFALREPTDITPEEPITEADETVGSEENNPDEPQKDNILISISRPLGSNVMDNASILYNFITHLHSEHQVS